ncbi:hypothetical protein LZ31DRAFT_223721 [Colletotrichum somersetense]|nr:hypothetical protein LZ31DRAFT_223721 [Colletotrichum somersetense]
MEPFSKPSCLGIALTSNDASQPSPVHTDAWDHADHAQSQARREASPHGLFGPGTESLGMATYRAGRPVPKEKGSCSVAEAPRHDWPCYMPLRCQRHELVLPQPHSLGVDLTKQENEVPCQAVHVVSASDNYPGSWIPNVACVTARTLIATFSCGESVVQVQVRAWAWMGVGVIFISRHQLLTARW